MISVTFPYPPSKGGTQGRTFHLLKGVSQTYPVTLLTQRSPEVTEQEVQELGQYVEELAIFPAPAPASPHLGAKLQRFRQFITTGIPPNVAFLHSLPMQAWLDEQVREQRFQMLCAEHSVNEVYLRPHWQQYIPTVVDIHSSLYRTCRQQLDNATTISLRDRLYLPLLKRYEKNLLSKFSQAVVTSPEDAQQVRTFQPHLPLHLIPNAVDLHLFPYRSQDPGGYELIFVGGLDYFVNVEAAIYLAQEIFPRIQELYPETTLTLVGSNPTPEVQALATNPRIRVTGRVASLIPYLHRATIAVIPLQNGFGMKFKTLEAMAAGVPVVASDRGLEGLAVDGAGVPLRALRANTREEYINSISRLFNDALLRETLSRQARQLIELAYTWERAGSEYSQLLRGAFDAVNTRN
jgi:glycosyltransferase involved in cell wall biosynthesis